MKVLFFIRAFSAAAEKSMANKPIADTPIVPGITVDFLQLIYGQWDGRTMGSASCKQRENWTAEQSATERFSMCPDLYDFVADECYVFQSSKMGIVMANMGFQPNGIGQLDFFQHCKNTTKHLVSHYLSHFTRF